MKKKINGKTILVTGGAGFIGSHLSERLLELGAKVICFDNLSTGRISHIERQLEYDNFRFIQGDINKLKEISKVFKEFKIDYVFHYAAFVGVKRTQENPMKVLRDINGIENILELSRKNKIKKVVYSSSSEVYGELNSHAQKEDDYPSPKHPYAVVKLVGETFCKMYTEDYALPTVSLRFFNVYGPRQEHTEYGFVTGIFMNQVIKGECPTVFNGGQMTRSFVYVADNVEASIRALVNDDLNGHCLNIGSHDHIKILDLAQMIVKISKKEIDPIFINGERAGEIMHRKPDLGKMISSLKYLPKYDLEKGLAHTYQWYEGETLKSLDENL